MGEAWELVRMKKRRQKNIIPAYAVSYIGLGISRGSMAKIWSVVE